MKRTSATGIIATAFAIGMLAFSGGTTGAVAASGDYCHNYYVTGKQASGATLSKAKQRARGKWTSKAVSVMGSRAGDWSIAKSKGYQCGRAGLFYCQAKAVPCKWRASSAGNGNTKPINGSSQKKIK
jgi:hypothetical protein